MTPQELDRYDELMKVRNKTEEEGNELVALHKVFLSVHPYVLPGSVLYYDVLSGGNLRNLARNAIDLGLDIMSAATSTENRLVTDIVRREIILGKREPGWKIGENKVRIE